MITHLSLYNKINILSNFKEIKMLKFWKIVYSVYSI